MSSISTRIARLEVAAGKVVQAKPVDEHERYILWLEALCECRAELDEQLRRLIDPKSITASRAKVAEIEAKGNPSGLMPLKRFEQSELATGALWSALKSLFDAQAAGYEAIDRASAQIAQVLDLPDGVQVYWHYLSLPTGNPARQRPAYQRYLSTLVTDNL